MFAEKKMCFYLVLPRFYDMFGCASSLKDGDLAAGAQKEQSGKLRKVTLRITGMGGFTLWGEMVQLFGNFGPFLGGMFLQHVFLGMATID